MENEKYLITTDNWFFAPDGKQYRAAWGQIKIFDDSILGIKTNRNSSNWYVRVGNDDNHIIIAGCQIHYSVKSDDRPFDGKVRDYSTGQFEEYERMCNIYFAE